MDEQLYLAKQREEEQRYEALCLRCGACCGAYDGDPCVYLSRERRK